MPGAKGRSGGRNAATTQEHEQRGTLRADRHGGYENPAPPEGKPEPPAVLDGKALEEWHRMVGRLDISKTLSVVDDAALYQYSRMFAETEAIEGMQADTSAGIDRLEENLSGLEKGELVACFQEITKLRQLEARYVTQVRQGRMALRAFLVEFGMTPAARSRVRIIGTQTDEPVKPLARLQQQAQALRRVK